MTTPFGGAPPANQNARRHGLYSKKSPLSPSEQIPALRAYMADLIAQTSSLQTGSEIGRVLRRLTLACNLLNRLVRARLFAPAPLPVPVPGFGYPQSPRPAAIPCSSSKNLPSPLPKPGSKGGCFRVVSPGSTPPDQERTPPSHFPWNLRLRLPKTPP